MALSDFVTVQISLTKQPVSREGFGTPLILAADCPVGFTNRVRAYDTTDDLLADGFLATGPTFLAAEVMASQDQTVDGFKVGRLANIPTQEILFTPVATNNAVYAVEVDGKIASYTADSSATQAEISAGLKVAIDALTTGAVIVAPTLWATSHATTVGDQVVTAAGGLFQATASTGSTASSGSGPTGTTGQTGITDGSVTWTCLAAAGFTGATHLLVALGEAAGAFHAYEVGSVDLLGISQVNADPGVAADLAAITTEDSDFYGVLNAFNSLAMATAISTWAEAQLGLKEFFADTVDSIALTTNTSGATDFSAAIQTAEHFYSNAWYSPSTGDFLAAAMCGLMLSQDAGSENWAMASPKVTAATLKANHRANLVARNCNFCETLGGQNNTYPGKVGSGEWIDVVRFRAWMQVNMQADVITAIKAQSPKKTPYTDAGIAIVQAAIQNVLNKGVRQGGLVNDPAPTVTVPKLSATSPTDRQNRVLTGVSWSAQLAEAINQVKPIKGQLTA